MPRQARRKGESGIYHVILRGINQQQIFEEDEDYIKFLQIMHDCKKVSGFECLAYCLMGNHIHLLIREGTEALEQIFRRIGSRFVYWYNTKYHRIGHLFQDRFKSEPVDTEEYFFTVLCYIHQNPIKAGLCIHPEEYIYSSYSEYIGKTKYIDKNFVLDMISLESFVQIHREIVEIQCLDMEDHAISRVTDEQAKDMIKEISGCKNIVEFQSLAICKRDKCLKKLRESGLSIRQIARLTGISVNVVRNS